MRYVILSLVFIVSCSPHGNKRSDDLMSLDRLPEISPKYSCDDLYQWRQEVLMMFNRILKAKEKQLKKHQ